MKNFIIGAALLALAGLYGELGATPSDGVEELTRILPSVRSSPLLLSAPAVISAVALKPFSSTPMVADEELPSNVPRIVSGQQQRRYLGRGDQVYAAGELPGARDKAACECEKDVGQDAEKSTHAQTSTVPAEESTRLLIIRVFDRVSYGFITQAREPVQVGGG